MQNLNVALKEEETNRKPFTVVFEGPKGIGKSTIIRQLESDLKAQGLRVEVVHLTKETGGNIDFLLELLMTPTCDVRIFDRLHISEVAYTEATPGRTSRFSKEELESITSRVDYTVLFNAYDSEVLLERIITRDGFILELDKRILKSTVEVFKRVVTEHSYLLSKAHIILDGYEQVVTLKEKEPTQEKILRQVKEELQSYLEKSPN